MSLQLAEQYEENEQYDKAYEEYKRLHAKNPDDLSLLERLGHTAMVLDKKDEAAEYYSKIIEKDMTNTMAYEQLMDIYVTTDKYKYYISRGNLHSVEHHLEHAINDFKKALSYAEEEKQMITTRFVLANLYEQTGKEMKAIDEYLKIIDHGDVPVEVYLKLANLYVKEDALPSAIDMLEAAKKQYDIPAVKETLAQLYLKNNQPEKALEVTEDELMKIKCLLETGETDEAYKNIIKNELKYQNNAQFYSVKAQYFFEKGDYDRALDCVKQYDNLEKNSPLTYQMRALIYENKNDDFNAHLNWGKYNLVRKNKDVAINEFLNAHQLNDKDTDLISTIAMLLEETGDNIHAVEFYEKLAKLEPTNKKSLEKLADFRESLGDYRMQADYLEQLYELDKRNTSVIKKLAIAYEKIKNKPAATEFYTKYLELSKGATDYEQVKAKLAKLENTTMEEEEGLIDKIFKMFNK